MALDHIVRLNGLFRPEELDFLARVFLQAITPHDSQPERTDRALAALSLFRAGVTDEETLVSLVSERLFTVPAREAGAILSP